MFVNFLARKIENQHSEASRVIVQNFYIDDFMLDAKDTEVVIESQKTVHKFSSSAGLPLRKYTSNSSKLLETLNKELRSVDPSVELHHCDLAVLTFGLISDPRSYSLRIK